MHFQRANGGDDDDTGRLQPGLAAFDIEEFFRAKIGAEACFGQDVAFRPDELQCDLVCDDRRIAVRDVGERPGMYKRRSALDGLHQIGHDRILHQDDQRTADADIVGGDGLARAV